MTWDRQTDSLSKIFFSLSTDLLSSTVSPHSRADNFSEQTTPEALGLPNKSWQVFGVGLLRPQLTSFRTPFFTRTKGQLKNRNMAGENQQELSLQLSHLFFSQEKLLCVSSPFRPHWQPLTSHTNICTHTRTHTHTYTHGQTHSKNLLICRLCSSYLIVSFLLLIVSIIRTGAVSPFGSNRCHRSNVLLSPLTRLTSCTTFTGVLRQCSCHQREQECSMVTTVKKFH